MFRTVLRSITSGAPETSKYKLKKTLSIAVGAWLSVLVCPCFANKGHQQIFDDKELVDNIDQAIERNQKLDSKCEKVRRSKVLADWRLAYLYGDDRRAGSRNVRACS